MFRIREEEIAVAPTPVITGAPQKNSGPINLGFLTVLNEPSGYLGGYLVTNHWGRPLEFRLTTAVQPNRVQQILYGDTLQPYVCADLIGKTLFDKAGVAVQLIVTDREAVLDLRQKVDALVVWLAPPNDPKFSPETTVSSPANGRGAVLCHPRFATDVPAARELLTRLDSTFDLAEPFVRIREAVAEARKLGAGR
jgi:hypothetical protein